VPQTYKAFSGDKVTTATKLLQSIPAGNYAVQLQEGEPFRFYRVSFPEKETQSWSGGRVIKTKQRCTIVQRRSSDDLKEVFCEKEQRDLIWYASEKLIDDLLVICADWMTAARTFAMELGQCARCAKALTDARSRWLGIGPTCEPHWQSFVDATVEMKGSFEEAVASGDWVG
jgi:hypothetical protein